MKKTIISLALIAALLTACAQSQIHFADPADVEKALTESSALAAAQQLTTTKSTAPAKPSAPAEKETKPDNEAPAEPDMAQPGESTQPEQAASPAPEQTPEPAPASTPAPQPEPTLEPAPRPTAEPAPAPADGSIPFSLAAGTYRWWKIDATDSAYWAVQEQINAMRAAGGLPALTMDDGLSAIASNRCESFVAGGPFDHSGMVTKSEICAAGPLFSASAVCAAWQASEAHYANIMRADISRMGVGCWFCEVDGNNYTYWAVTFE